MAGYLDCPYCDKETMVEFEEHNPGQDIEDYCEHCEKEFTYQLEIDVIFSAAKKDALVENSEVKEKKA